MLLLRKLASEGCKSHKAVQTYLRYILGSRCHLERSKLVLLHLLLRRSLKLSSANINVRTANPRNYNCATFENEFWSASETKKA